MDIIFLKVSPNLRNHCVPITNTDRLMLFNKVMGIIYNKPTRCNSGSIVFIKNYRYALHVSDALCVHLQEHYKL